MNARQILYQLKSDLERDQLLSLENPSILTISGDDHEAKAILSIPVEGAVKLIEIKTKELLYHTGLE